MLFAQAAQICVGFRRDSGRFGQGDSLRKIDSPMPRRDVTDDAGGGERNSNRRTKQLHSNERTGQRRIGRAREDGDKSQRRKKRCRLSGQMRKSGSQRGSNSK